jgi:hypothetical protein
LFNFCKQRLHNARSQTEHCLLCYRSFCVSGCYRLNLWSFFWVFVLTIFNPQLNVKNLWPTKKNPHSSLPPKTFWLSCSRIELKNNATHKFGLIAGSGVLNWKIIFTHAPLRFDGLLF